jgi:hypothetical protein
MSTTVTVPPPAAASPRAIFVVLSAVMVIAAFFVATVALPYFSLDAGSYRNDLWVRRWWVLAHIAPGIVALLAGPVQLWLGLTERWMALHRPLGIVYVTSVAISAAAGYYLAFSTSGGWVFGFGLAGLATAWVITTGLAVAAVRRHLYDQHKEWMIRSYVVTTAFVSFRIVFAVLAAARVGTKPERLAAASWVCWAVPLLITEAVLQGRRILAAPRTTYP